MVSRGHGQRLDCDAYILTDDTMTSRSTTRGLRVDAMANHTMINFFDV